MPPGTWKHRTVWNAPHICGESVLLLFINYLILKKVNNKTSALLEGRNSDKWKGSLSPILTLTLTPDPGPGPGPDPDPDPGPDPGPDPDPDLGHHSCAVGCGHLEKRQGWAPCCSWTLGAPGSLSSRTALGRAVPVPWMPLGTPGGSSLQP